LRGAVELARERGGTLPEAARLQAWRARGTDPALVADAARDGVRFTTLTAIAPQPRLACLANQASDGLDPDAGAGEAGLRAQLRLRIAVQPWIDAPQLAPLRAASLPTASERDELAQLAREHGLALPAIECGRVSVPS
jgi:ribonucleoside-diphosphate reductase alpha chain